MDDYKALKIIGFDYLEFAVADLDRAAESYLRMGFEKVATREILERQLRSHLMMQNGIAILLSHSRLATDPVSAYVATHGDGLINIAFRCEDAVSALEVAVNRGAELAEAPKAYKKDFGSVQHASIKGIGDLRHSFVSREGFLFAEGFDVATKSQNRGIGLEQIDHVGIVLEAGQLDRWAEFYSKILGLRETQAFKIGGDTGVVHKVFESPDGVIKLLMTVPSSLTSPVQEFIDVHHGSGAQHAAFSTGNLVDALRLARREGIKFMEVPDTYYADLPGRLPGIAEYLGELQELGILADGRPDGYLLQIYSQNLVGPFLFELIQRKGYTAFGEHNLRALYEVMERDQIRRGIGNAGSTNHNPEPGPSTPA